MNRTKKADILVVMTVFCFLACHSIPGPGFKHFWNFPELIQFDLRIFFKWVVQSPTSISGFGWASHLPARMGIA